MTDRARTYLVAGGGHGRVILDSLLENGIRVDGIIDGGLKPGENVFGIPVVGDDSFLSGAIPGETSLINGFGAVKSVARRREHFDLWTNAGYHILGVVHPSVIRGRECSISNSAQVFAGAILQNRVTVSNNVVIYTGSRIDHDCKILDHSYISPAAVLCGGVAVGSSVLIGAGAVILPGVKIGDGAVVGAGAVVTQDVLAGSTVVGNPARAIREQQ